VSLPEQSLSYPKPWPEHPEYALSQPAYYNIEPILASYIPPSYSFLSEFCPGIPFYSFIGFLLEQFWIPLIKEHVTSNSAL
jgi:hypothetical protein